MKKFAKTLTLALAFVMCAVMFVACTHKSADGMRDRYEKEGYTVVMITESTAQQYGITEFDKIEWACVAMKGLLSGDMAVAICFKDSADAKDAEKEFNDATDADKGYFFRSGKVCVTAMSEAALKIAK